VHVTPNSKAPGLEVEADGTVHVNLAAPPREGMANLELCQVLAKALHVPKTALEVVAGSSGRPNQAQEVQVRERVYPLMFQLPGLKHEKMAKDLLRVLDDGVNYEDWIDMDALPVMALNGQMQAQANRGDMEGDNGEGGGDNAPAPPEPSNSGPARPGQAGFGGPTAPGPTAGGMM
jgi:uncharacterized protein YggU (UPF0235/DUF167 family)